MVGDLATDLSDRSRWTSPRFEEYLACQTYQRSLNEAAIITIAEQWAGHDRARRQLL